MKSSPTVTIAQPPKLFSRRTTFEGKITNLWFGLAEQLEGGRMDIVASDDKGNRVVYEDCAIVPSGIVYVDGPETIEVQEIYTAYALADDER